MRLLPDWLDGFVEFTDHLPSPLIFRKWGGIAALAGALERKVWVKAFGMELFPHLYTVLVGPPGVGKSVITRPVETLWRGLEGRHVAPKSLTKASLIDSLNAATRSKTVIGANSLHLVFNSLLVNAGELGVLLPSYDPEFMSALTDIWDSGYYEERRRAANLHIKIKHPQLNILAACTPSYLNSMLPDGAWDQGFLSRTFLVYSGETTQRDIFSEEEANNALFEKLKSDLNDIGEQAGPILFSPEARDAIRAWHSAGGPPVPDHPKLTNYLTRRPAHVLKLCMIACMSDPYSSRVISLEHFQRALGWLLEMESILPDIFKALGARGDGEIMAEAWHWLFKIWQATKKPIGEHRLINYLAERVPSYSVLRIAELMERSGQVDKTMTETGHYAYIPRPPTVH